MEIGDWPGDSEALVADFAMPNREMMFWRRKVRRFMMRAARPFETRYPRRTLAKPAYKTQNLGQASCPR